MTMNISNKYAKIQKWSKGSKAILVTIFAILHEFCWNEDEKDWYQDKLMKLEHTLNNSGRILGDVSGTHFAARNHRRILKNKVGF